MHIEKCKRLLSNSRIPTDIAEQIIKDQVSAKLIQDLTSAKIKPFNIIMMLISSTINFPSVIPNKRRQYLEIFEKYVKPTEKKTEIEDYLK